MPPNILHWSMWMFAKSITLTNVILLENDLNFFLSKCGLQKYYIDQCYTFGKHITLFNVILLEKYNNFSHIIFTPICTHYWNANPVTLAILHWKIHTFFPWVKTSKYLTKSHLAHVTYNLMAYIKINALLLQIILFYLKRPHIDRLFGYKLLLHM